MIQEKFSYSTQPHAAPVKGKGRYRDENDQDEAYRKSGNIMQDDRVIRGSTYAKQNQPKGQEEPGRSRTVKNISKRKFVGRRAQTPPPVDGRVHSDMQTDDFLEELTDRPIEADAETQTQQFMDRPPSPLFVKAKTGLDAETQIMPGDLFNFDLEVTPILEVLVGKTLHVAMLELVQEEELEAIRLQQEEFSAIRNIELAEVQRLEAEAKRRFAEKERRLMQEKIRVENRRRLDEKIAARSFSRQYLGSLHASVFEELESEGVFFDPLEKEVSDIFMVEVLSVASAKAGCYDVARAMADELLADVRNKIKVFEAEAIRLRHEMYERLEREKAIAEEAARVKAAEEEAARAAAELAAQAGDASDDQ